MKNGKLLIVPLLSMVINAFVFAHVLWPQSEVDSSWTFFAVFIAVIVQFISLPHWFTR